MPKKDMYNDHKEVISLVPASRTADANGSGVDLAGFRGAMIVVLVGANGITFSATDKIEFEVEESDDNVTFTDVANADLLGYQTGTNTGTVVSVQANAQASLAYGAAYIGTKRYIRVVENFSGTHGAGTVAGAVVIKGQPEIQTVR